jgi:hypothetical protein
LLARYDLGELISKRVGIGVTRSRVAGRKLNGRPKWRRIVRERLITGRLNSSQRSTNRRRVLRGMSCSSRVTLNSARKAATREQLGGGARDNRSNMARGRNYRADGGLHLYRVGA